MTAQTSSGPHVPEWTWGDRLRKVRRESGLKQGDFAEAIGAKEKAYGAWEADANTPKYETMLDVARRVQLRFGVPLAWMLGIYEPVMPDPTGPGNGPDGTPARTQVTVAQPMRWFVPDVMAA